MTKRVLIGMFHSVLSLCLQSGKKVEQCLSLRSFTQVNFLITLTSFMSQQGSSAQHGHAETQASKAATIPCLPITKRKREQGEAGTGPYRPTALPLTRVSSVQGGTGPHSLQGDRDTKCRDAVTNDYKRGG